MPACRHSRENDLNDDSLEAGVAYYGWLVRSRLPESDAARASRRPPAQVLAKDESWRPGPLAVKATS